VDEMKKVLIVVALVVVGLLGYNLATTGEFSLIPSFGLSEEERQVKELENSFESARRQINQAFRSASVSGMDTTADVEAGRRSVQGISRELKELRRQLTTESARQRADDLADALNAYSEELR
jgi:hypothetical protein